MKKWNKYPCALKRKLYLTPLTGTAGVIVSFMVYMVSVNSMLLSMSGVVFLFCLLRSASLWNIIRRDAYAAISGACAGITVSPLRKYKRVQIIDPPGREHSLLFNNHTAVQTGEKYCFYLQNENSPVLGNNYLDIMSSTNTFLGYEKLLEYHAEIKQAQSCFLYRYHERRVLLYKPGTIEQYKTYSYLKEKFYLEESLLHPISRTSMLLEDKAGDKPVFEYQSGSVREIDLPSPPDIEEVKAFLKSFHALGPKPCLDDFESITLWWLEHPNPLTLQQALGLTGDLYRHFLVYPLIDDETVRRIVSKGLVTEEKFLDIRLWYRNGRVMTCWPGQLGLNETGNIHGLVFRYRKPNATEYEFYLLNDYYRSMNHIPDLASEDAAINQSKIG